MWCSVSFEFADHALNLAALAIDHAVMFNQYGAILSAMILRVGHELSLVFGTTDSIKAAPWSRPAASD
jgi:hypothetical protein